MQSLHNSLQKLKVCWSTSTISRVMIDLSGEPFVDLAQEAAGAFARD
ncbi:hypothetical protein [Agromyces humi]|nr:hypothetical protein [Agromyces humi]